MEIECFSFSFWVWDMVFCVWGLEFGVLDFDVVFGMEFGVRILGLEFCSLGVRVWDYLLGLLVLCLVFGMLEVFI